MTAPLLPTRLRQTGCRHGLELLFPLFSALATVTKELDLLQPCAVPVLSGDLSTAPVDNLVYGVTVLLDACSLLSAVSTDSRCSLPPERC